MIVVKNCVSEVKAVYVEITTVLSQRAHPARRMLPKVKPTTENAPFNPLVTSRAHSVQVYLASVGDTEGFDVFTNSLWLCAHMSPTLMSTSYRLPIFVPACKCSAIKLRLILIIF
jgi:hypothetical protein